MGDQNIETVTKFWTSHTFRHQISKNRKMKQKAFYNDFQSFQTLRRMAFNDFNVPNASFLLQTPYFFLKTL